MNREELLNKLNNLQGRLLSDVDDGYKYNERSERIADIADEIHQNEIEITNLLLKLEDNSNYMDNTPRLALDIQIGIANDKVEDLKIVKSEIEANLEEQQAKLYEYDAIISAKEAEIKSLKDNKENKKLEAENIDLEIAWRRARVNKTPGVGAIDSTQKLIEENEKEIARIKESIKQKTAELREEIKNIKSTQIKPIDETISGLNDQLTSIDAQIEEAQKEYEKELKKRNQIINGKVDIAKKNADRRAVKSLEATNSALEAEQQMKAYDFAGEVKKLIEDFGTGAITIEVLKEKLEEIKGKLPSDFIVDEQAKIDENLVAQEHVKAEIAELEAKLSDEANYQRDPGAIAREQAQVAELKKRQAKYKKLIPNINKQNREIKSSLKGKTEIYSANEKEINELNLQIQLNYDRNRVFALELEERRNALLAENRELESDIELDRETIRQNDATIEYYRNALNRTSEVLERHETKLKDNSLDKVKMRADELKLLRAKSGLEALVNYNSVLSNNVVTMIDEIINSDYTLTGDKTPVAADTNTQSNENLGNGDLVIDGVKIPFPITDSVKITDEIVKDNNDKETKDDNNKAVDNSNDNKSEDSLSDDEIAALLDFNKKDHTKENDVKESKEEDKSKETVVVPVVGGIDPSELSDEERDLLEGHNNKKPSQDDIGLGKEIEAVSVEDATENQKEQVNKKGFFAKAKSWVKDKLNYVIAYTALALATAAALLSSKIPDSLNVRNNQVIESTIDDDNTVITSEEDSKDETVEAIVNEVNNSTEKTESTEEKENEETVTKENESNVTNNNNNNNNNSDNNGNGNNDTDSNYYTETTTTSEEVAKPVDPSTIIDEHPDTNNTIPEVTPDQGEKTEVSGVTGNETVDDDWGNPTIDDKEVENKSNEDKTASEKEESKDNTSSTEKEEEIDWGSIIIDDEFTNSDGTAKDQTQKVQEEENKGENEEKPRDEITDPVITSPGQTKVILTDGETFVINGASIDNNGAEAYKTDKDIMLEDQVTSVQYVENAEENKELLGEENIEVGVAKRDHVLSSDEVETIRKEEYNTTSAEQDEETRIWLENHPEMAAQYEALLNALNNSNTNSQEENAKGLVR